MKFKLSKTNKTIEIMRDKEIRSLENLGFKFVKSSRDHTYIDDKDASIEIKTIDDLLNFMEKWGKIIIEDETITIYDDYVE